MIPRVVLHGCHTQEPQEPCYYLCQRYDAQCKGCARRTPLIKDVNMSINRGKLVVFEGPDSVGKSTQVARMVTNLMAQGYKVLRVREPGGTEVGEQIREILIHQTMHPHTELLLFTASRMELIQNTILPALNEGTIVICDRFYDSTLAYQGYGRNLLAEVLELEKMIRAIIEPDFTFYLVASPETVATRIDRRQQTQDRFESKTGAFKELIPEGFRIRAAENFEKSVVINAEENIDQIHQTVMQHMESRVLTPMMATRVVP